MRLKPFMLDVWLDQYEHNIEFNLAASTGPTSMNFVLDRREVLNSVMLYHCVQAGLDLAIVNSEKLERYVSIPEEERQLAARGAAVQLERVLSAHPWSARKDVRVSMREGDDVPLTEKDRVLANDSPPAGAVGDEVVLDDLVHPGHDVRGQFPGRKCLGGERRRRVDR